MPKNIYVHYLTEKSDSNLHYLNRLIKILHHFILIESSITNSYEHHHIVPRSWQPEWVNKSRNILKVPTKAHYVIHHLMMKAFPTNIPMVYAFWRMSNSSKYQITARLYGIARSSFVERITGENNPFFGKLHSEESIIKIKNARQNQILSDKQISQLRTCNLGKRFTEDHKRKISESLKRQIKI
jgi:hypothetical protein